MEIERIIVSGSVKNANCKKNIDWLYFLFRYPLRKAFGVSVERYYREGVEKATANTLFIGFELYDEQKELLRKKKILFIDLRIHPVRFLEDILLSFEASDTILNERVESFTLKEESFFLHAGIVSAGLSRKHKAFTKETLLIIGQTEKDKVLFDGVGYKTLSDYKSTLISLSKNYESVLYKPHPYAKNAKEVIKELKHFLPSLEVSYENGYALLSDENVTHAVGLNSSLLYEAPYFGVESTFLYQKPFDFSKQKALGHLCLTPSFWQELFSLEERDEVTLGFVPNRLRNSLHDFWGYSEVMQEAMLKDLLKVKFRRMLSRIFS